MDFNFDDQVFDELSVSLDPVFPEILAVFFEETESSMGDLKVKIDGQNINDIHDIAHKIKSSTKTFGATGLADILEEIENSQEDSNLKKLHQAFVVEYKLVKEYILKK